jgi:hypothetical protein
MIDYVQMTNEGLQQLRSRDDVDVVEGSGKVLYFSIRSFIDKIAGGNVCFICGADPGTVVFNDEHVIPEWILARHNLHARVITLPNEAGLKYGQYKIPCCENCNSEMSQTFEKPISDLVKGGYTAVTRYLVQEGPWLIFKWLALIYLKTHLKDRQLRFHLDRRKGDDTVAQLYDWMELHHIHCIARAFHTGATLDPEVLGTLFVWPARSVAGDEEFDYGDSYLGRTILLRLGEIAFIAVLNDSNAVRFYLDEGLQRIDGLLSSIQLRELMTRMAFVNIHLSERPRYHSGFKNTYQNPDVPGVVLADGGYTISATLPTMVSVEQVDPRILGDMLAFNLIGLIGSLLPPEDREPALASMKDGRHSFIFGSEGEFLTNPKMAEDEVNTSITPRFSEIQSIKRVKRGTKP